MLKQLMRALTKEKHQNDYIYPTAVLCVDSAIDKDIIERSEHILKHNGYIVVKVQNFKNGTGNEATRDMYDNMDMQSIRNADIVVGVSTNSNGQMEDSIKEALKYAKECYVMTDTLHFV